MFRTLVAAAAVATASAEVYFEEDLMPWRKAGDQRIGPQLPSGGTAPVNDQPPGIPAAGVPAPTPENGGATAAAPSTLQEAFDQATRGPAAVARRSATVLILFSGPKNRPDGLAAFLLQIVVVLAAILMALALYYIEKAATLHGDELAACATTARRTSSCSSFHDRSSCGFWKLSVAPAESGSPGAGRAGS